MSKIAVVTVCYNAAANIEKTVESVLAQNYGDCEYYIYDGASTDNTVELIQACCEHYYGENQTNSPASVHIFSEPDGGIYDAMNKAIDQVDADWILFINAGDYFVNNNVLQRVSPYLIDDFDFVYGNTIYVDTVRERNYRMDATNVEYMRTADMAFCHQAVFNRTRALRCYHYNTDYKLAADYDCYLRALCDGRCFRQINIYICYYLGGGASDRDMLTRVIEEQYRSQVACRANDNPEYYYKKSLRRHRLVRFVYGILPNGIVRWIKRNKEYFA